MSGTSKGLRDGCGRHRRRCRAGRAGRHPRADQPRQEGGAARPGERRQPRRAGVLVVRRPVPGRQSRAAPDGHQGLLRAGLERLAGQRRVRPPRRRGPLGGAVGAGLRRVRRGGEAVRVWPRHGITFLPTVGWAERGDLRAERARQLGAPVPRPVGHRHRRPRAVRRLRPRRGRPRVWSRSITAIGSTSWC